MRTIEINPAVAATTITSSGVIVELSQQAEHMMGFKGYEIDAKLKTLSWNSYQISLSDDDLFHFMNRPTAAMEAITDYERDHRQAAFVPAYASYH